MAGSPSTRKNPLLWGRENIFVTQHGVAHAIFALTGMPYGYALTDDKVAARAAHQSLFQGLRGEYTLYSFVADTDPVSIYKSMVDGIDLEEHPGWENEAKLTLKKLERIPSGERLYFITIPLSTWSQPINRFKDAAWAAHQPIQSHLGLPVTTPSEDMFARWKRRARELSIRIPAVFNPVPVSMKAIQWIWDHAQMRGIGNEAPYPADAEIDSTNRADSWTNLRSLPEPLLDEGGMSDFDGSAARVEAFKRRYLKVEHPDSFPTYQTQMIMSSTPIGGFTFPGGEFLEVINRLPVDCEFVLRINVQSKTQAARDSKASEKNIADQYLQRDGDGRVISGGLSKLDQSTKLLEEFVESLNASDREVKVNASLIFSVSGDSPELVEEKALMVQDYYADYEFLLDAPVGDQRSLWWDMLPGTVASTISNELTQVTTGFNFSIGVPLVETQLGEDQGFLIAENLSSGRNTPVYMDPGANAEDDMSGSFGAVGELGSGKSAFLKTVAAHTINRGGQVLAVDNSDNMEWAALAQAMTDTVIMEFEDPRYSLDPLRMTAAAAEVVERVLREMGEPEKEIRKQVKRVKNDGKKQVLDLFSMLFAMDSTSPVGLIISRLLNKEHNPYFHEITSVSKLHQALATGRGVPEHLMQEAKNAALMLDTVSDSSFLGYLFDDSLPLLDMDASAIIFATHGLDLPSESDLSTAEMRQQMTLTKKIAYMTYGHIAASAYTAATRDARRDSLFLVDEAAHLTASPEACHRVEEMIRRGRKHKAAIGLGSHSARDFGTEVIQGLIPHRFLFRTRDAKLANVNLSWLQEGYDVAEYRELLAELSPKKRPDRRGECVYRDIESRIGKIKIQLPLDPKTRKATLTTPPKKNQAEQQQSMSRSGAGMLVGV